MNIKSFLKLNIQFHASTNVAHCASWNAVWALKEYCNMPLNCISDIPLFVREIIKTICFADEEFTWISVHSFCDFFIWNYFQMKKIGLKKGLFIILSRRKPLTALSSFNKCFALCIRVRWNRLQWLKYPKLKFCCTLSYVKLNFNMGLPSYI